MTVEMYDKVITSKVLPKLSEWSANSILLHDGDEWFEGVTVFGVAFVMCLKAVRNDIEGDVEIAEIEEKLDTITEAWGDVFYDEVDNEVANEFGVALQMLVDYTKKSLKGA